MLFCYGEQLNIRLDHLQRSLRERHILNSELESICYLLKTSLSLWTCARWDVQDIVK